MTVLEIMTGQPPYYGRNVHLLPMIITRGELPSQPETIQDGLWNILQSCWAREPTNRPTTTTVMDRLLELRPAANYPSVNTVMKGPSLVASPNSQSEVRNTVIGRSSSASSIIALLGERGCENLTSQLNLATISELPVANGSRGDVYFGRLYNDTKVAVKIPRPFAFDHDADIGKAAKHTARELYIWLQCSHPNVTRLSGLAQFRGNLAILSRWADNGTLPAYLTKHSSANRCSLITAFCDGLAYLHENNIVHGNIRGNTILVSANGTPMLGGFAGAILEESTIHFTATTSLHMSVRWMAPEILQESTGISRAGDVYALGMTILETITGRMPFSELQSDVVVVGAVALRKMIPSRPEDEIPSNSIHGNILWALLSSCWARKPKLRPSAAQVRDSMRQGQANTPS